MAVSIPIISEFDGKGITRAVEEFRNLEGAGAKAQFALKKAVVPATAAIAGLAAGLGVATKAAIEDGIGHGRGNSRHRGIYFGAIPPHGNGRRRA